MCPRRECPQEQGLAPYTQTRASITPFFPVQVPSGHQKTAAIAEWGDDTPAHPSKPAPQPALRIGPALACIAIGLAVRFLIPIPAGVLPEAWTLLATFCATIAGKPALARHMLGVQQHSQLMAPGPIHHSGHS